jgi:hypothetical protein
MVFYWKHVFDFGGREGGVRNFSREQGVEENIWTEER